MEHVNHPKHYNSHPNGIECIDIIRHYVCDIANAIKYLWRAGLKPETGMEDAEKEIEDLKKAIFYINDYINHGKPSVIYPPQYENVERTIGHTVGEVIDGFKNENIAVAIGQLLYVGYIYKGKEMNVGSWIDRLKDAIKQIQQRILDIECSLTEKELKETVDVLHGKAIDGEDYVSKPGCVRETEPDHYDPQNMIVAWGRVYSLTDEVRKKDNGAIYSPCENCDLWSHCHEWQGMPTPMLLESPCHYLCARIHNANDQQYYREVGVAKYSPKFGTVEVMDEHKEIQLELKKMEEEE